MKRVLAVLAVALLACASVDARPRHWYTDWKTLAGVGVIAGSLYADADSTCKGFRRGLVEGTALGRGSQSCGAAISLLAVGGVAYTGFHIFLRNESWNESSRGWLIFERIAVPVTVCSLHCTIAASNYGKIPPR